MEDEYSIIFGIYDFFLVACFIVIAFIVFLDFIIWSMKNYSKTDWHSQGQV